MQSEHGTLPEYRALAAASQQKKGDNLMSGSPRSVQILLTAAEAYPALEHAFLNAKSEIHGSFLVFDLSTRLRSAEAQAIGQTWFDLVVHTLNRGVAIHITHSDVDPIARAAMHRAATRNMRRFAAAAAVAEPGTRLTITRALHPARTGALIRVAIWPYIMKKLFRTAAWLNGLLPEQRGAAIRDMDGAMANFVARPDGKVFPRLWSLPALYPVTHHQKLAVIDGRQLYIGGLDLDERRYDTPQHRRAGDQTWHDVQLLVEGPAVAQAQVHLEEFQDVIAGKAQLTRAADGTTRHFLRTLSRPQKGFLHFGPQPMISELYTAHLALVQRAKSLIYLESQYFRDIRFSRALARAAYRNPALQLILILPAAPDEVAFEGKRGLDSRFGEAMQARALRIIRRAFRNRLFVASPAQPRPSLPDGSDPEDRRDRHHAAPLIYVHAKVSIFDDTAAIVSSANLNGRSFKWDTEAGLYLSNPVDVAELRHRAMAHWLPRDLVAQICAPECAPCSRAARRFSTSA
jgi:phosphatidylserine/phosphatidylglycerophosphate/cardiolipin synthase-like enzyme